MLVKWHGRTASTTPLLVIISTSTFSFFLSLSVSLPSPQHADPSKRPTVAEMQTDDFFTWGYAPQRLPTTCLTVPPRFSIAPSSLEANQQRKPLTAINSKGWGQDYYHTQQYFRWHYQTVVAHWNQQQQWDGGMLHYHTILPCIT